MLKKIVCLLISVSIFSYIYAGGKKETEEKEAAEQESWLETFDISEKKTGKYNIMITATDRGGNQTVAGPYNIFIDPESDLPVTGITNPSNNMRVPGNLNIVGTCVDDDAVDYVEIILDDNTSNPIRAEGKEFWSYFLDTTQMSEGSHKVSVYGVDINGLKGHEQSSVWHLDRRMPETKVTNIGMGTLVSGKIEFSGEISDGNGIKSLSYSIDGGTTFKETKIQQDKTLGIWTFRLPIDTTKMKDGATVCWFKAIDLQGTIGYYSFLYFVDNTKPVVRIIYPHLEESVNGLFSIAGYATDVIGIQSLTWQFGTETGEFELIPGNPYWSKEFDLRGVTATTRDLTITATDTVGNITIVKQKIPIDQSQDLAKVEIQSPSPNEVVYDSLFIRGIATDDDGVSKVYYSIDNETEKEIITDGVIHEELFNNFESAYATGNHTLSIYASDINDVKGTKTTIPFVIAGKAPEFTTNADVKATINTILQTNPYTTGMEIHPESNASYNGTIISDCGITNISWTFNGILGGSQSLNSVKGSAAFSIPLTETPWGFVETIITATDIYQRKTEKRVLFNFTNLSRTRGAPAVVFTDSQISSEGILTLNSEYPVSGYFVGGNAVSVEIVPPSNYATATLASNNLIQIIPNQNTTGTSTPVIVRVKTDRNLTYDSNKIKFRSAILPPVISINQKGVLNGNSRVAVSGRVSNPETISSSSYRIISTTAPVIIDSAGTISGAVQTAIEIPELKPIPMDSRNGSFSLNLASTDVVTGISIIEFVFTNKDGASSSEAVFVRKVPDLPPSPAEGKVITAAKPTISWAQGDNLYYTAIYQGGLSLDSVATAGTQINGDFYPEAGIIRSTQLQEGANQIDLKVKDIQERVYSSRYTANKEFTVSARFDSVNGSPYISGMPVTIAPKGTSSTEKTTLKVVINTGSTISGITYSFNGKEAGRATAKKNADSTAYEAEIPLNGLSAELTTVSAVIEVQKARPVTISGTISVVRQKDPSQVFETRVVHWEKTPVDSDIVDNHIITDEVSMEPVYILNAGELMDGFFNVGTPCIISLEKPITGISVTANGNHLLLAGKTDGIYRHIVIKAIDPALIEYKSEPFTLLIDSESPKLYVDAPSDLQWIQNELSLSGLVSDTNGISTVEYSFDNGITWEKIENIEQQAVGHEGRDFKFYQTINTEMKSEGLITINIRVIDKAGKTSFQRFSMEKDTIAPDVTVIIPSYGSVINGETLLAVKPHDAGKLSKAWYRIPLSDIGMTKEEFELFAASPEYPANFGKPEFVEMTLKSQPAASTGNPATNTEAASETPSDTTPAGETTADNTAISETPETAITDNTDTGKTVPAVQLPLELKSLVTTMVGTKYKPLLNHMQFVFTDKAGNVNNFDKWDFVIDAESDKPVVEIHLPSEQQIIQRDFIISGVIYDDDGDSKVWYKIDDGEFTCLDKYGTSFSITMPLDLFTDNEHSVSVYAEDIHGIIGDTVVRTFKISLAEPTGEVQSPPLEETVKETIVISGVASDKNGIAKVQVSLDNGNSFNDAVGDYSLDDPEVYEWSYTVDTRVIQDGTHVVFIKVFDNYDVQGLYSSLINIDNTQPEINLELPQDGTKTTGMVFFSGQTTDNIGLTSLYANIRNLDSRQAPVPAELALIEFEPSEIITNSLDVSVLQNGFYNIEVVGEDAGGNITRVSRNIQVDKSLEATKVNLLYPMNGEHIQGLFNLYGMVESEKPMEELLLYIDDTEAGVTQVTDSNYFKFVLTPEIISSGTHKIEVRGIQENGEKIVVSNPLYVNYTACGPWIAVDNFTMGDFAIDRPYLEGSCGYAFTENDLVRARSRDTPKDERQALLAKTVDSVEISFDNGKSFTKIGSSRKWRYRIENGELAEGYHFLIVRVTMKNGETAVTRMIIKIDKTAPTIKLISPGEGGYFNQELQFAGLSSDDVKLESVVMSLRSGDKASYEVPSFIQGLYFDWHFWGASLYDIGLGLTFFDDNVKLQFQFGQMTQEQYNTLQVAFGGKESKMRYGGNILGGKLLANIGYLPFSYFFGPNWEWLSASFALGANFSVFTETQSGKAQILSALIGQIEFPKITIPKQTYFRTFSFYTELQLWFLPTDVESGTVDIASVKFQPSAGIRVNVF